jgi:deoxyribose-phosphate aldolase
MLSLSLTDLAGSIVQNLFDADASAKDIEKLCAEAREHRFRGVCVNGTRVEQARALLEDTDVKVVAAIGFPLGATSGDVKRFETEAAIDEGAQEIDLVLNLGRLKDGNDKYVLRELRDVVEAADERPVTVLMETVLTSREEIIRACELILESGAHGVAANTGLNAIETAIEDIKLLRESAGPKFVVKALGGIRDAKTALAMISAGATCLGTPNGVAIVKGLAEIGSGLAE